MTAIKLKMHKIIITKLVAYIFCYIILNLTDVNNFVSLIFLSAVPLYFKSLQTYKVVLKR